MGKIIKSGVEHFFGGTSAGGDNMAVLTRAEYDALVEAGTVDEDIYYFISDDGSSSGSGAGVEVIDNLTSTDTNKALSANQGNVLNDKINKVNVYVGEDGKLHFVDSAGADSVLPFSSLKGITSGSANTYKYWYGTNSSSGNPYLKVEEEMDFNGSGILFVVPSTNTNVTMTVKLNDIEIQKEEASVAENYATFGNLFILEEIKEGDTLFVETNSNATAYGYARCVLYCCDNNSVSDESTTDSNETVTSNTETTFIVTTSTSGNLATVKCCHVDEDNTTTVTEETHAGSGYEDDLVTLAYSYPNWTATTKKECYYNGTLVNAGYAVSWGYDTSVSQIFSCNTTSSEDAGDKGELSLSFTNLYSGSDVNIDVTDYTSVYISGYSNTSGYVATLVGTKADGTSTHFYNSGQGEVAAATYDITDYTTLVLTGPSSGRFRGSMTLS